MAVASDTTKVSKSRLPAIRAVASTEAVNVDNQKTEDLTSDQLQQLLIAMDNSTDVEAKAIMRLALFLPACGAAKCSN